METKAEREKEKDEPVWVKEDKILSAEKRTILSKRCLYKPHGNHKSKTQNIYTKPERNPFLHKHTTKENHQTTREETKRTENYRNNQKTSNKKAAF